MSKINLSLSCETCEINPSGRYLDVEIGNLDAYSISQDVLKQLVDDNFIKENYKIEDMFRIFGDVRVEAIEHYGDKQMLEYIDDDTIKQYYRKEVLQEFLKKID